VFPKKTAAAKRGFERACAPEIDDKVVVVAKMAADISERLCVVLAAILY
jgi:hypothetical protein